MELMIYHGGSMDRIIPHTPSPRVPISSCLKQTLLQWCKLKRVSLSLSLSNETINFFLQRSHSEKDDITKFVTINAQYQRTVIASSKIMMINWRQVWKKWIPISEGEFYKSYRKKRSKQRKNFRGGERSRYDSGYYQGSRDASGYLSLWTNFIIAAVAGEKFPLRG